MAQVWREWDETLDVTTENGIRYGVKIVVDGDDDNPTDALRQIIGPFGTVKTENGFTGEVCAYHIYNRVSDRTWRGQVELRGGG